MRLRAPDLDGFIVALVLTVLLVPSPVAGAVSGGSASPADSVTPTQKTPTNGEDCVISGDGAAYPDQLSVDCTPTVENASVVLETSGGWGYVVSLNASSSVRVPTSSFRAIDGETNANPEDVTDATVSPGETAFVGPISANTELTDVLRQEWLSHIAPIGDGLRIVTQTGITALPGGSGEPEARYFRSRSSRLGLDLDPGVYRAQVVIYETTPPLSLENSGSDLDYEMSRALSNAPRTAGTITFRVGGRCESGLEDEETRLGDLTEDRNRRAEASGLSKGSGDAGLSSLDSIGPLAGTGPSDAMTDGLPDLSGAGPQIVSPLDVARKQQAASEAFQNVEDPPELVDPDGTDGEYGDDVRITREQPRDLSSQEATDLTVEALAERGIEPPQGLSLEDYVRTDTVIGEIKITEDGDHIDVTHELEWEATVRVGPNGNILPKHSALPEVGPCDSETLQKATSWLKIRFHYMEGGDWAVAVQRIEVSTSRILEASMAGDDEFNPDAEAVTVAAVGEAEWLGEATDGTVPDQGGDD